MKLKCRSTYCASQLQIRTVYCYQEIGGGGEGGGLCTRKEKSYRMGTHVHTIVDCELLIKPCYFSQTIAILRTMKSNYGCSKSSPSNHHDSPIHFLLLSKSGENVGMLTTSPYFNFL